MKNISWCKVIELRKWNYSVCCLVDIFLISLRHLQNITKNSSISGVQSWVVTRTYRVTMLDQYRVIHLGWVDFYLSCSTFCPVLLGLMGIWQKGLCNWARWWNTQIKVNPTQVLEQMNHPVPPLSYSRLQVSPIGYLAPPPQRWGLKAQENFSSGLMSRPDGERNIR